jgi:integrase
MAAGQPSDSQPILAGLDPSNYRNRHLRRVCERAGIGRRRPKGLRDTFASQLITAGVQLG